MSEVMDMRENSSRHRRALPNRRAGITKKIPHHTNPASTSYLVTLGFYPDGSPAEIFINTEMRYGTESDTMVADFAVVVSLALQHGCSIDVIRAAMKRNGDGSPTGIFAHLLDQVATEIAS